MSICITMTNDEKTAFLQSHEGLIHSVAQKFKEKFKDLGFDYDDLTQEITMGFLKAMDHFDPNRGSKLTTYAVEVATNEILQIIRHQASKGRTAIVVSFDMGLDDEGVEKDSLLNQDLNETDSLHSSLPDLSTQMYNRQVLSAIEKILRDEIEPEFATALVLSANGYSQEQIAKRLKTSQSRISKMIKLATCELRLKLQARGII